VNKAKDTEDNKKSGGNDPTDEMLNLQTKEHKTRMVVFLAAAVMTLEITFGYFSNSLALLADGYHMATHVLVFGLSWVAYVIIRKDAFSKHYFFNKEKVLSLSGFISAATLLLVAVMMITESVMRLFHPEVINFRQAIIVAAVGLGANLLSALFLHHPHPEKDHNFYAAYLHVLADGLTSFLAIVALLIGMQYNLYALDAFGGIVSALVIARWSILLILKTSKELVIRDENGK
jgi:cation diffusion facilitator family transporter